MGNFLELRVWQLAKELAIKIYKLTSNPTFSKDYGLKDQIQRSAVSNPLLCFAIAPLRLCAVAPFCQNPNVTPAFTVLFLPK
jgi:hypothetical protein